MTIALLVLIFCIVSVCYAQMLTMRKVLHLMNEFMAWLADVIERSSRNGT